MGPTIDDENGWKRMQEEPQADQEDQRDFGIHNSPNLSERSYGKNSIAIIPTGQLYQDTQNPGKMEALDEFYYETEFYVQKKFDSSHPKAPRRSAALIDIKTFTRAECKHNVSQISSACTAADELQDINGMEAFEKRMAQRRRQKLYRSVKSNVRKWSWKDFVRRSCPLWKTLRNYNCRSMLADDISAGIAEGIMAVPMGMSYALLASMPPAYGLYNGIFFPLLYTFLGTGRQPSVGVSAIEALLCSDAITSIIGFPESSEAHISHARIEATIGLSICLGIVQIAMRCLGLGVIAHFIADPVLQGFTTGSAFLIGSSQVKHLTGLKVPHEIVTGDFSLLRTLYYLMANFKRWNWSCIGIGICSIIILTTVNKINKKYCKKVQVPASLIVVILFTSIAAIGRLDIQPTELPVLGVIPRGFPTPGIPQYNLPVHHEEPLEGGTPTGESSSVMGLDTEEPANDPIMPEESTIKARRLQEFLNKPKDETNGNEVPKYPTHVHTRNIFLDLLRESVSLWAMFFVIHISVCKTTAQRKNYEIDANQELLAQGVCNIIGGLFRCFPCATSLSRTSVVLQAGSETVLHNIPYAAVLCLTVSVLTPLLYYLPYTVLAAVVLAGVWGMMKFQEAFRLIKLGGTDALMWIVAFGATVVFGAMHGIIASVVLSVLWILKKTARPSTAILGRLPDTRIYRNTKRFPMALEIPQIKIFRFDASLNFSNADNFELKIKQLNLTNINVLIIDAASINAVDVTAVRMLQRLAIYLQEEDVELLFANWKGPMRDFLESSRFYETVPPDKCFLSLHDAVLWAEARQRIQSDNPSQRAGEIEPPIGKQDSLTGLSPNENVTYANNELGLKDEYFPQNPVPACTPLSSPSYRGVKSRAPHESPT